MRAALREALRPPAGEAALPPPPAPRELHQPTGCFVSLHERETGKLRGCIGRLEATIPLWEAAWVTAGNVLEDPRFVDARVSLAELSTIDLEISVLSPLRPVESPLAFEPDEHGIYLMCGERTGCFLPQVARETGWTREQLLERLCTEKMRLDRSAWRGGDARLYVFSALVIGPEPAVGPVEL